MIEFIEYLDERKDPKTWTEVRIHMPYQFRDSFHAMLEESKVVEAHHGHGTPILSWMKNTGEQDGFVVYLREIKKA